MSTRLVVVVGLCAAAAACSGRQRVGDAEGARAARRAAVTKGDFAERLLLTGELDAVSSESLAVPRTPQWNLSLRWLEVDGTAVTSGQKVAEFDNSAFANNLAEQKLAAANSANDLASQQAQNAIAEADKRFAVDKARLALDKAKLEASVAPETMPRRVYQEKQLALQRAQVDLAKATDELEANISSASLDIKVKQIALEKARREIQTAETAIESVVLRAPRDGIVVVADHPWEGRKLEAGDNVWVGLPVVRLPDLKVMKVNALLSDVDDGRVIVGMRAKAFLDAYPGLEFPGTVTDVSPVAREPSQRSLRRSFLVTMTLERTDAQRMRPGMSVRVEIEGKNLPGALLAPRASVDLSAKPPRLTLDDGTTVDLDSVVCNPQRCAIQAPSHRVQEGTRLGAAGGGA